MRLHIFSEITFTPVDAVIKVLELADKINGLFALDNSAACGTISIDKGYHIIVSGL